jgi:hypothetical protein
VVLMDAGYGNDTAPRTCCNAISDGNDAYTLRSDPMKSPPSSLTQTDRRPIDNLVVNSVRERL